MPTKFPEDTAADWRARARKELRGREPDELNWTFDGQEYPPIFHPASYQLPATGYPLPATRYPLLRQKEIGIGYRVVVKPRGETEANATALDALRRGANVIAFVHDSTEGIDKKTLYKDILLDLVTIYHEPGDTALDLRGHDIGADAIASLLHAAKRTGAETPTFWYGLGDDFYINAVIPRVLRAAWKSISENDCTVIAHYAADRPEIGDHLIAATAAGVAVYAGGADTLLLDAGPARPRQIINVHHILNYEAKMNRETDPLAGSHFFEALTADLTTRALEAYQNAQAR